MNSNPFFSICSIFFIRATSLSTNFTPPFRFRKLFHLKILRPLLRILILQELFFNRLRYRLLQNFSNSFILLRLNPNLPALPRFISTDIVPPFGNITYFPYFAFDLTILDITQKKLNTTGAKISSTRDTTTVANNLLIATTVGNIILIIISIWILI